jgi:hypothetical protein
MIFDLQDNSSAPFVKHIIVDQSQRRAAFGSIQNVENATVCLGVLS